VRARLSGRGFLVCLSQALTGRQQVASVRTLRAHDLVDRPRGSRRLGKRAHPVGRLALSS
jgi:hypothetical protein